MKRMTEAEIREVQLNMLQAFITFCAENNLRYFMDAGSLLGTIRHNGFIPWDDDIDIGMPRDDYEKLLQLGAAGFGSHYIVTKPEDGIYVMAKVIDTRTLMIEFPNTHRNEIGVYIDLFPKDGIKNLSFSSYLTCEVVRRLGQLYWFNKLSIYTWERIGNRQKKIIAWVGRKIIKGKIQTLPLHVLDKISRKNKFDESKYCATIIAGGMRNCVLTEYMNRYEDHVFEHLSVKIPVGYDHYLRKLYSNINNGEYMELPPIHQRVKHDNEAYWI